jgi:GDP-L-fucose synthase
VRVLVLGGNGFLGSSLVPKLRARGHEVYAPRSSAFDLLDPPQPPDHFHSVDVVVHAAALYGGMPFDMANQGHVFSTNTRLNLNAFEVCRQIKPGKLITIGSACSYSGDSAVDLAETDFFRGPLHSTVECHGFTKLWMIPAHRAYKDSFDLNGIHLVPANLYGPNDVYQLDRAHVVAALIKKYSDALINGTDVRLMGDGSAVRELLYVDDLAEATVRAAERLGHEELPINIGTGVGHSIRALSETIASKLGFRGDTIWDPRQANGAQRKVMNVSRMHALLGPFAPLSLSDGLDATLSWYLPRKATADLRA